MRIRLSPRTLFMILLFSGALGVTNLFSQSISTSERIDSVMSALHRRQQFNGVILVSAAGRPLYRNAFGPNYDHGQFEVSTACTIASLAKGFTAMAVMMLAEKGKLTYDDPIVKYLPELTRFSKGITIRHLLTHTSGIPDVGDLGIDDDQLTNARALKSLERLKSDLSTPGRSYRYSNTGYLLLATIAERITNQKFPAFVTERILIQLQMKNTRFIGKTFGMGDMESTVDDLLKWEESFYTDKLVHQSTLETAFTPYQVQEGTSTYGFGWNVMNSQEGKFVWHTGNASGYRAFIGRYLTDKIAVIMLTAGDSKRMEISEAIVNVIHGKPYTLPPMPIADKLHHVIVNKGIEACVASYDSLKSADARNYDFGETQLNSLGYRLVGEKKYREAVAIFKLNTVSYPESSNAFDSLGEGYYLSGDKAMAIQCYERAIELDENNMNARNMLKKLVK